MRQCRLPGPDALPRHSLAREGPICLAWVRVRIPTSGWLTIQKVHDDKPASPQIGISAFVVPNALTFLDFVQSIPIATPSHLLAQPTVDSELHGTTSRPQSLPTCELSVPAAERQRARIEIVVCHSCKLDVEFVSHSIDLIGAIAS
jgi:hypothetical protein